MTVSELRPRNLPDFYRNENGDFVIEFGDGEISIVLTAEAEQEMYEYQTAMRQPWGDAS